MDAILVVAATSIASLLMLDKKLLLLERYVLSLEQIIIIIVEVIFSTEYEYVITCT